MFRKEETGFGAYAGAIIVFLLAVLIGYWLPDIDLYIKPLRWIGLLRHRSMLTHGCLISLAFYSIVIKQAYQKPSIVLRYAAIGAMAAMATHLCFDLFPYGWRGFARLHLPFFGYIPNLTAQIWLFAGAVISFWLCCRLLRNPGELLLLVTGIVGIYLYGVSQEPRLLLYALLALVPTFIIGFVLPRSSREAMSRADLL